MNEHDKRIDNGLEKNLDKDLNRDPITGATGSHPVGTGIGAATAGAAGAVIGSMAGPVGAVAGAAIGAVVGGLAGKGVGEAVNPTAEEAYWRDQYPREPYYAQEHSYNEYAPAYRTGYEARTRYAGRGFDEVETDLEREYNANRGESTLPWDRARPAARAAWDRIERTLPGDADRDGK